MKKTETRGRETKGKPKRRNREGDRKVGHGFMRIKKNIHRDKECETNTGEQRHRNAEQ